MEGYTVPKKLPITDLLRKTLNESGVSKLALARETGVARPSIIRFARGEQSLMLDAADKLAAYFGLELATGKQATGKQATGKRATGNPAKRRGK
jgi:transcriptional regulator with XRE-family HTH domain